MIKKRAVHDVEFLLSYVGSYIPLESDVVAKAAIR